MQKRHLHGIPDAFDLAVESADVVEGHIRRLFKHQIINVFARERLHGICACGIHHHVIAHRDVEIRQRSPAQCDAAPAGGILQHQSAGAQQALHTAHGTRARHSTCPHQHQAVVEQHFLPRLEPVDAHLRRHHHNHAARSLRDFSCGLLLPAIDLGFIHPYEHRIRHRRMRQIVEPRAGVAQLLARLRQSRGKGMIAFPQCIELLGKIFHSIDHVRSLLVRLSPFFELKRFRPSQPAIPAYTNRGANRKPILRAARRFDSSVHALMPVCVCRPCGAS